MQLKTILTGTVVITMTLLFSGCVSKNEKSMIESYAKASKKANEELLATYTATQDEKYEAVFYSAVRDGSSFKQLKFPEVNYTNHQKVLNDLVSFSDSLISLTSDDIYNKVDENNAKFYESAKNLAENDVIAYDTKEDLELLSTIINGATRGYLEYTRFQNTKGLMIITEPWIRDVTATLTDGLDDWKERTETGLKGQFNSLNSILVYPKVHCEKQPCIPHAETFKTKLELYKELYALDQRIKNLDKEFEALKKTLTSIATLHSKVVQSLKDDEIDFDSISDDFNVLKTHVDDLKKYKNGLEDN